MKTPPICALPAPAAVFLLLLPILSGNARSADEGLKAGDRAPDFSLPMATKDTLVPAGIRLSDALRSGAVVLAFYPADWSGGCTKEMCTLRDNIAELSQLGISVYGISGDYIFSHRAWAKELNLPFALLSDHDHAVARLYRSYNPSTGYNLRTVFVINRDAVVAYVDPAYVSGSGESLERLRAAVKALR